MASIFLSYNHLDNAAPPKPGWVEDFHLRLTQQLAIMAGVEHEIWFDREHQNRNERLAGILTKAAEAAVLVTVLGPPHVNSQWCRDELRTFLGRNKDFPRPPSATKRDLSFVFGVFKFPLPNDAFPLPTVLEQILDDDDPLLLAMEQNLPYVFHEKGPPPRTFNPEWEQDKGYHLALNSLAYNLAQKLAPAGKVALFGAEKSKALRAIRKGVTGYGLRPLGGLWPAAPEPREHAIATALDECELVVIAFDADSKADCWDHLERAVAESNVRKVMLWLDEAQSSLARERFVELRSNPPEKCELYESSSVPLASLVQAVRENLLYFEKHPRLPPVPAPNGSALRPRVHVVYRSEDAQLAQLAFKDAEQYSVQTVDVPFTSLDALSEHARNAEAILVASSSEETARPLMRRVAPRLETNQRAGVGFAAEAPTLEGDFRWLGKRVPGIFAAFPGAAR
ncbi:MAG TPA: toll/interleukin-1 receptor domain-containing protein [Polyangiaceae bacterium]|nr:toll/interleukin-1 receptor domain-containing protein [Polyangiaceae bacterium]